jgi:tetratricopeptide (TPR) repeat protein
VRHEAWAAALAALAVVAGCREPGTTEAKPATGVAAARDLVGEGRFDEAIALLGTSEEPEAQCVLGKAWAGKALKAPLPTPVPGQGQAPMKPEDRRALDLLEKAVAARPDLAECQLAIARVLSPYALARSSRGRSREAADASVDRVLRAYSEALQADPASGQAAEGLIDFATRAGRVDAADEAYKELLKQRREDPALLVRYGDFLAEVRKDPDGAAARYAQALIWKPDDQATRRKIAEIQLAAAASLLGQRQYAAAEARLRDVRRLRLDAASPEAARLAELEGQLREIRWR